MQYLESIPQNNPEALVKTFKYIMKVFINYIIIIIDRLAMSNG